MFLRDSISCSTKTEKVIRQKVGGRQDKWVMLLLTCFVQKQNKKQVRAIDVLLLRNKCGLNYSRFKLNLFLFFRNNQIDSSTVKH